MKCVDPTTDTIIAYAQWTLPLALWERLRAEHDGGAQAGVTDEMRAVFEREHAESCTSEGEPKGLRMEVVEFCTPAQSKANARCFPFEGGYISMSLLGPRFSPAPPLTVSHQCSSKSKLSLRTSGGEPDSCSHSGAWILRIARG